MNLKKAPIHVHHMGSHFTSALFPVSSVLLTLFVITGNSNMESAAFYCMVFGLLAIPVTYVSGAYDWKTRFSGRRTRIFDHKLVFGVIFMTIAMGLLVVRIVWPAIMFEAGVAKWLYLFFLYAATGTAAYLGRLGSKFI
jgi:uncharacterized membrane protein